jgi:hypothetical protein
MIKLNIRVIPKIQITEFTNLLNIKSNQFNYYVVNDIFICYSKLLYHR